MRRKLSAEIIKTLRAEIDAIIEDAIQEECPCFEKIPHLCLVPTGLYVSPTTEDEHAKPIPWKVFVDTCLLEDDVPRMKIYISRLRKLADRMELKIKSLS